MTASAPAPDPAGRPDPGRPADPGASNDAASLSALFAAARQVVIDVLDTARVEFAVVRIAAGRLLILGVVLAMFAIATLIVAAIAAAVGLHALGLTPAAAAGLVTLLLVIACAIIAWRIRRYARLLAFPALRTLLQGATSSAGDARPGADASRSGAAASEQKT